MSRCDFPREVLSNCFFSEANPIEHHHPGCTVPYGVGHDVSEPQIPAPLVVPPVQASQFHSSIFRFPVLHLRPCKMDTRPPSPVAKTSGASAESTRTDTEDSPVREVLARPQARRLRRNDDIFLQLKCCVGMHRISEMTERYRGLQGSVVV